jgi:hypothetical protein
MANVYLFGGKAGDFDFSDGPGASRYFILTTVTMSNCQASDRLHALTCDCSSISAFMMINAEGGLRFPNSYRWGSTCWSGWTG